MLRFVVFAWMIAASSAPPGMSDAGVRAAAEHRYCDASSIFVHLHGVTHDPLALYRAAETAFAAGDFVTAIRLYRTLLDNHPQFDRAPVVQARIAELVARVAKDGPGTPCTTPARICGDWIVSTGEGCDDGNLVDGDGCDATCMPTGCGNGTLTGDESCDDGNVVDGDGCDSNCTPSACGNGAVSPQERCDDGNVVDGDGCDANCTPSACGNGVRASGEACDDGNLERGDGCDAACNVEAPTRPPPWTPIAAGSGLVVAGAVAALIGALPLSAHEDAVTRVRAAADLEAANPDEALARATEAQADQARAQTDWATWGLPALALGGTAVVGGVTVVGAAVVAWLAGADDPVPSAAADLTAEATSVAPPPETAAAASSKGQP